MGYINQGLYSAHDILAKVQRSIGRRSRAIFHDTSGANMATVFSRRTCCEAEEGDRGWGDDGGGAEYVTQARLRGKWSVSLERVYPGPRTRKHGLLTLVRTRGRAIARIPCFDHVHNRQFHRLPFEPRDLRHDLALLVREPIHVYRSRYAIFTRRKTGRWIILRFCTFILRIERLELKGAAVRRLVTLQEYETRISKF